MKILPTIGPSTENINDLRFLFKYCSMARLNSSHNEISWHKKMINLIKKVDNNIDILIDIPGVKPRTSNKSAIKIKKNEIVYFGHNLKFKNKICINLTRKLPQKKDKFNVFFYVNLSFGHRIRDAN